MTYRSRGTVLVIYGSRAGSTREVAERIASSLRARKIEADVAAPKDVEDLFKYKAFILGSCVYNGSWLPEVVAFVREHRRAFARRPVWLFSVGAFSDTHPIIGRWMKREPKEIEELSSALRPRSYRVFAGVIDPERWSAVGRFVHHAFGGRDGDNRNWSEIEAWAASIADALRTSGRRSHMAESPGVSGRKSLLFRSVRATREEGTRPLAGDRLIERSIACVTHATTIHSDPEAVWPWLVQMGAGTRAGWYSYDLSCGSGRPLNTRFTACRVRWACRWLERFTM